MRTPAFDEQTALHDDPRILLDRIEALASRAPAGLPVASTTLAEIAGKGGERLHVRGLVIGDAPKGAPTLVVSGGVHGLERIGAEVVVAYLEHLLARASWDAQARARLSRVRVVALPLVNPGGFLAATRSNPRGVDLMRNAPVEAAGRSRVGLAGGHRITPRLPWYRGLLGAPLEAEAKAYVLSVRSPARGEPARGLHPLDARDGLLALDPAAALAGFVAPRLVQPERGASSPACVAAAPLPLRLPARGAGEPGGVGGARGVIGGRAAIWGDTRISVSFPRDPRQPPWHSEI